MPFDSFNLFIGPPKFNSTIHIDNREQSYAINYIWGDSESKMRWFIPKERETPTTLITTAGTDYMTYNDNQVELIEEIDIPKNTLLLVRTDIPHQVINYSDHKRYCVSVRGRPIFTWDQAVSYFQSIISTD